MDTRCNELSQLHSYIEGVDKEVTMILQNLQWDRKRLLEGLAMVTCCFDKNHKVPVHKKVLHEQECFLTSQGYMKDDKLLPDPLNVNANTLVKFNTTDIISIIDYASKKILCLREFFFPSIIKGMHLFKHESEPCTLERLQATYTADERRAVHDAVVRAVPSCHDLADLALSSNDQDGQKASKSKSRAEILAELRDMKRRRAKYRVAAKSRNYSDVLRDVIKTQMELYAEVQTADKPASKYPRPENIKLEKSETPYRETQQRISRDKEMLSYTKSGNGEYSRERKETKYGYSKSHEERDFRREDSEKRERRKDHHSRTHVKHRSSSRDRTREDISDRDDKYSRKYKHKSSRHEEHTRHYVHTDECTYDERRKRKKHS